MLKMVTYTTNGEQKYSTVLKAFNNEQEIKEFGEKYGLTGYKIETATEGEVELWRDKDVIYYHDNNLTPDGGQVIRGLIPDFVQGTEAELIPVSEGGVNTHEEYRRKLYEEYDAEEKAMSEEDKAERSRQSSENLMSLMDTLGAKEIIEDGKGTNVFKLPDSYEENNESKLSISADIDSEDK